MRHPEYLPTCLAVMFGTLCVLSFGTASAASDVQVLEMILAPAAKADQAAPNTVYEGASLKATCRYRHATIDPQSPIPPIVIQFYRNPPAGGFSNFTAKKACPATSPQTVCTADTVLNASPVGTLSVRCEVMEAKGPNLFDANPSNNKAQATLTVVSRPQFRNPAAPSASSGWSAVPSGAVKSCRTSLSAAVKINPDQFVHPAYGPADTADTSIMLHLQKSQAAGNNINCYYATQGKDVPSLVVTIKCPNAAAQGGDKYACSQ